MPEQKGFLAAVEKAEGAEACSIYFYWGYLAMMLPDQLRSNEAFRFIKLRSGEKIPVSGESWLKKLGTWQDAEKWLEKGFNVGIVGGYGRLQLLDVDKSAVKQGIADKVDAIAPTFMTHTPNGGFHFYYLSDFRGSNPFGEDLGEWRGNNQYVVVPGCKLADGRTYVVWSNVPILEISPQTVAKVYAVFGSAPSAAKETLAPSPFKKPKVIPESIDKLITQGANLHERNHTAYRIIKELRNRGFEPSEIWALLLTFDANCRPPDTEERKKHFDYVLAHADRYLVDLVDKAWLEAQDWGAKPEETIEPLIALSGSELADKEIAEPEWLVEKILPSKGLAVLSARGKAYKTMTAIRIAAAVARGEDFYGLNVKKGRALFFDAEIGPSEFRRRKTMIENGMGADRLDELFSVFPMFNENRLARIDTPEGFAAIERTIEAVKPALVVFDVFRRFHRAKEDKADDVNRLYAEYLLPLIDRHDIAVLMVFHNRKRGKELAKVGPFDVDPLDMMDEMRSSSEWANIADSILLLVRFGSKSPFFALFSVPRRCEGLEKFFRLDFDDFNQKMTFTEVDREIIETAQEIEDNTRLATVSEWLEGRTEFTTGQLKELFTPKLRDEQANRILAQLLDSGRVKKHGKGCYYVITVIMPPIGEFVNHDNHEKHDNNKNH